MKRLTVVLLPTLVIAYLSAAASLPAQEEAGAEPPAGPTLTIGSAAPELHVEHWVQNGQGKFKPVTKFEPGKVYVVEFWATWCGPCVASMPHLASLQQEYAEQGVQIISISDEDLETVEGFLEREVPAQEGNADADAATAAKQTFRELTSAYCLTTDPDESSSRDYMQAAQQNGIPTAFIVGKDAKIEWIGHPMQMDGPLQSVVKGEWDRDGFAKVLQEQEAEKRILQQIVACMQQQDFEQALTLIDGQLAAKDSMQLKMVKLQLLLRAERKEDAAQHAQTLLSDLAGDPSAVNMVAWNVYMLAAQGQIDKGPLIDAAITATEQASQAAAAEERGSVLDTLAHLYHFQGDLDKAIALEREAVQLSNGRERQFIEGFLKELEAEKAKAE